MAQSNGSGHPERYEIDLKRQALAVFESFLELDEVERQEAVSELKLAQPQIAAEVIKLLRTDATMQAGHASAPPPSQLLSESRDWIDSYAVTGILGRGASGTVYRCTQSQPRRDVAIKVLHATLSDSSARARFEREASLLSKLNHPNIAKIYEVSFTQRRSPYIVMEYVSGVAIDEYIRGEQPGFQDRLALFLQICDAIAHAHRRGVIHRDLKPSNILVDTSNIPARCCVIDFGVSTAIDGDDLQTKLTHTGSLLGTPQYMSPEQLTLIDADSDTRSDIYALGLILFEIVVGVPAFKLPQHASTPISGLVQRVMTLDPPRATRSFASDRPASTPYHRLPAELDWITQCAMSRDPSERFQTVDALAKDVRALMRNEPVATAPPNLAYKSKKFFARNRALCMSVASAVLVLIAATVVSLLFAVEASKQSAIARSANNDLSNELMVSQFRELSLSIDNGEYDSALVSLENLTAHRGTWLWQFFDATVRSHADKMPSPLDPSAIAVSPDGALTAIGTTRGELRILRTTGDPVALDTNDSTRITHLAWNNRGDRLIAVHEEKRWAVYDVALSSRVSAGSEESRVLGCVFIENDRPSFVVLADDSLQPAQDTSLVPRVSLVDRTARVSFPGQPVQEDPRPVEDIIRVTLSPDLSAAHMVTRISGREQHSVFSRDAETPYIIPARGGPNGTAAAMDADAGLVHLCTMGGSRDVYDWRRGRVVESSWMPLVAPIVTTANSATGSLLVADSSGRTRRWSPQDESAFRRINTTAQPFAFDPIGGVLLATEESVSTEQIPGLRTAHVQGNSWLDAVYCEAIGSWAVVSFDGVFGVASDEGDVDQLLTIDGYLSGVSMCGDRPVAIVYGLSKTLTLYDLAESAAPTRIEFDGIVFDAVSNTDGSVIAVGVQTKAVLLVDQTGETLHRFECDSAARHLAFAENGEILLAGHENGTVTAYSMSERRRIATYAPHEETVTGIVPTRDGFVTIARNERPKFTSRAERTFSVALPTLVTPPVTLLTGDGSAIMFSNGSGQFSIVRPSERQP